MAIGKALKVSARSVADTRHLGGKIAQRAGAGDIYALVGTLGVGKTEFVRGFVAHLAPLARVRSPSFTILNVYEAPDVTIYHFDFYRLSNASELTEIGLSEYLTSDGICLIEWADLFAEELPAESTTTVRFDETHDRVRQIQVDPPNRA